MEPKQRLILASASPRRREILQSAGLQFDILAVAADETITEGTPPYQAVQTIAKRKTQAAVTQLKQKGGLSQGQAIIGADTVVCIHNQILGKPTDETQAFSMINMLAGRWHSVYTGLAVAFVTENAVEYTNTYCQTKVKFKPITESTIWEYIHTRKPLDKAGAYGIQDQDGMLVEQIEGDYNNVVGLPLDRLLDILRVKK